MTRDTVKARKVGDSVVITLTKPILDAVEISEGDSLVLETTKSGRVIVWKEGRLVTASERMELELELVEKKRDALDAEMQFIVVQHNSSMPSAHPWVDDASIMDSMMHEMQWQRSKLDVEIVERRLELLASGGGGD